MHTLKGSQYQFLQEIKNQEGSIFIFIFIFIFGFLILKFDHTFQHQQTEGLTLPVNEDQNQSLNIPTHLVKISGLVLEPISKEFAMTGRHGVCS